MNAPELGPDYYSARLGLYREAATTGPSGSILADGRIDLQPGFDDGLARSEASPTTDAPTTYEEAATTCSVPLYSTVDVTPGVSCDEADRLMAAFRRGEGDYPGGNAGGAHIGEWTCYPSKGSDPVVCEAGDNEITAYP